MTEKKEVEAVPTGAISTEVQLEVPAAQASSEPGRIVLPEDHKDRRRFGRIMDRCG